MELHRRCLHMCLERQAAALPGAESQSLLSPKSCEGFLRSEEAHHFFWLRAWLDEEHLSHKGEGPEKEKWLQKESDAKGLQHRTQDQNYSRALSGRILK